MARRSRSGRVTYVNARPGLPASLNLSRIQDHRLFHPDGIHRRQLAVGGSYLGTRIVVHPVRRSMSPAVVRKVDARRVPFSIGWEFPEKVIRCVRRKRRREVIMAKYGGGGGMRKPRRNVWSNVFCK